MSAAQVYGADIGILVGGMFSVWLMFRVFVWLGQMVSEQFE